MARSGNFDPEILALRWFYDIAYPHDWWDETLGDALITPSVNAGRGRGLGMGLGMGF